MTDPTTPLWAMLITVVALGAAGVALVVLARRSRDDRLPRNQIAGIRTPLTLSSDAAWFAAQRASASASEIAGWGTLIGAARGQRAAHAHR